MKKVRRILMIVIFFSIVIALATGFYYRSEEAFAVGDKIIGIAILSGAFVLMPIFLYHRWKDRNVTDYMLNEENIRKMRDYNDSKESDNQ